MRFDGVAVVDGSGAEAFVADVVVEGDRIAEITRVSDADPAGRLVLAPGFIDVHTHDDTQLIHTPEMAFKTLQGVTSVVVGNCGFSAAPALDAGLIRPAFASMTEYFDAVDEAAPAVNATALVGHGTIRGQVMGVDVERAPTHDELAQMADHVAASMDAGAIGLSSGLVYEPGRHSSIDEMKVLVAVVAETGGIYTTHMRDESEALVEAIDEALDVAESAGVRLQISHLKASKRLAWGLVGDGLAAIDAARVRGVDVKFDQYPYTRGSTMLEQVTVSGAFRGEGPFGPLAGEDTMIASAPGHPEWEGQTLDVLAADELASVADMADLIVAELGSRCMVVLDIMCERDVQQVMVHPQMIVGSDGVYGGSRPHPRLHHTFPRVLGHYSRDLGLLGLPAAIRAMTSAAAERFGFAGRGLVALDSYADLVLFDPATIADTGTYMDPTTVPSGIHGVWVNGVQVVDGAEVTGERPGRLLRA